MKKLKLMILPAVMTLALSLVVPLANRVHEVEPDNLEYDDEKAVRYERPDVVFDGEETIPEVDKVILHYHNDDGRCGTDTTSRGTNGGRAFYIWAEGVKGVELYPDSVANDGQDMMVTIDFTTEEFEKYGGKSSILLIIKFRSESATNENWGGQSSDTLLSFVDFPPKDKVVEVWTMHNDASDIGIYKSEAEILVEGIKVAYFSDYKTIHCKNTAEKGATWTLYAFDETFYKIGAKQRASYEKNYAVMTGEAPAGEFDIRLPYTAHINMVYNIKSVDKGSTTGLAKKVNVTFDNLYDNERFEQHYTYSGEDLGMTYTKAATTFKVWAPTAANMTLRLYDVGATTDYGGNNRYKGYHMAYTGHGVWSLTMQGDIAGKFYTYAVDNTSGSAEVVDPYATACGVNGLRGYVYDKATTNPEGWDELPLVWDGEEGYDIKTPQELTIYEVHVQDFTGDESWNGTEKPGTYKAFVEKGTHLKDDSSVSTGYDHLNELGVKAVQILPFFDHDNDETQEDGYNWGYNPANYNCLEGAYSSDPTDPLARIREFKNLVLEMSKTEAKTRVIMDVVYNHVSRVSACSFTKLMPKYYFRLNADGSYADGSGCSNEVRTEATMMRKFIIESVMMWAKEYKIKGFRFDLMGLIDIETLGQLKQKMYAFDKDVYLYGEGWSLGYNGKGVGGGNTENIGKYLHDGTTPGIVGGFNDAGRNAIRGGNDAGWGSSSALPTDAFMQKGANYASAEDRDKVAKMVWGINTNGIWNPKQTVNYASCHDNWTVFDQMYYTLGNWKDTGPSYESVINASITTHSVIMASNSAAFMLGGEEIYRTKELTSEEIEEVPLSSFENMYGRYVSHNSYNSPLRVNTFKWGNKVNAHGVDVKAHFETWKNMIKLHSTMTKLPYKEPYPYTTSSSGHKIDNISWAGNDGAYNGSAGIQLDEYFIFVTGREWAYVGSDASSWNKLYSFGEWKHGDYHNSVDLGNLANNTGFAIVVFKR